MFLYLPLRLDFSTGIIVAIVMAKITACVRCTVLGYHIFLITLCILECEQLSIYNAGNSLVKVKMKSKLKADDIHFGLDFAARSSIFVMYNVH